MAVATARASNAMSEISATAPSVRERYAALSTPAREAVSGRAVTGGSLQPHVPLRSSRKNGGRRVSEAAAVEAAHATAVEATATAVVAAATATAVVAAATATAVVAAAVTACVLTGVVPAVVTLPIA